MDVNIKELRHRGICKWMKTKLSASGKVRPGICKCMKTGGQRLKKINARGCVELEYCWRHSKADFGSRDGIEVYQGQPIGEQGSRSGR
jgi:hypothetical protein